jgi:zinc D-Ala-D-Ala carboxypeptidase
MVSAARSSGVNITTISAFRSVEDQKRLFFGVGAARGQQPTKRAEVSAPPKYSEHHTGYAIDVGDASVPATNLNQNFDTTPAYKWLKANAATYSFELSFPKDNIQKVSYEPWHWRFVGDINSLETFYKAHNLQGK